jgi:hypothetical protein
MISAGLVILWVTNPAYSDSLSLETFKGPKGNYYRIPPGYLWENGAYDFSIMIPKGVEGCTDDWFISSHGPVLGSSGTPCLKVFKHPSVSVYAGYTSVLYSINAVSKHAVIREICGRHRVTITNISIDGYQFLKCWKYRNYSENKGRYIDYFTLSEPTPGLQLNINIACPSSGNCRHWIRKWEKLVFDNLHIQWLRDDASDATRDQIPANSKDTIRN